MVSQNAVSRVRCNDHFGKKWVSPRKNPASMGGSVASTKKNLAVSWSNGQKWSKNGQKLLTMTMAKSSKLPWSNVQNWSILTIDKSQGIKVMVNFLTME